MRTHIPHLSLAAWALLGLPLLVFARCLTSVVVPDLVHAVLPEAVRALLSIL